MRINKTDDILNTTNDKESDLNNAMEVEPNQESNENTPKANIDDEFDENDYSRPQATFQFKIENFSKFSKQALSPPCYIRNLPWKILGLVRTQERVSSVSKFLGFFLQCNAEAESQTWSCHASAVLKVLAQDKEKGVDYCKQISHLFYVKENDWGYNQFMSFKELMDPEKGYYKDDSIILEVSVRAEAPHGVSWDSKKHTGYVGLKNQGATCYMNSILQTLFFTNQLRKDVYQIPTEGDAAGNSVALALQRVFYELQTCDKPVGTKKVTKSFGWETLDSFMQHDVQEFCRVLLDKIESKMKGSLVEGKIPKLFEGKMISYIKCKNVDYCSSCIEAFYDIQLNVKDMKNIYESFKQYINPQTLDGENKYDAGAHGLQEAEKGVKFVSFPPVLHLQLMRYEYDPTLDTNVKINDRFEFPEKLILEDFLDRPEISPATYILHAVLVHSGDNHGGHYVVYIDPKANGKWCKFDDDVVSRCAKREAIDNNFGGSDPDIDPTSPLLTLPQNQQNPNLTHNNPMGNSIPPPQAQLNSNTNRNTSNAYMLVYIRESAKDHVLSPVTEADIPILLVERLKEEKRIEMIKRKEKNEAHLYFNVDIFFEDNFYGHNGHDLFDHINHVKRTFKSRRESYFKDFIKDLANYLKYAPGQIRVWPLFKRSNNTIRFTNIDPSNESKKLYDFVAGEIWTVFLETVIPDADQPVLPPFDSLTQVLLFLKFYDPKLKMIYYCGHAYADVNRPLNDLAPVMRQRAGLPDNTPLFFYEEISYTQTCPIQEVDKPLGRVISELMNGDIIVFQKDLPDLSIYPFPTPMHYFSDIYNHIDMQFCDKNKMNDPGFKLSISTHMLYQEAMQYVANYIGTDKKLLQFFTTNPYRDTPQNPIKSSFSGKFGEIFQQTKAPTIHKIFYQKLCMPLDELEAKNQYKCVWVDSHYKEEKELVVYVNKSATVADLLQDARKKILASFRSAILLNSNHICLGGVARDNSPSRLNRSGSPNIQNSQHNLMDDQSSGNVNCINCTAGLDFFDSPDPIKELKLRVVDIQSFKTATVLKNELKLENLIPPSSNTALDQHQFKSSSMSVANPMSYEMGNPIMGTGLNLQAPLLRIEEIPRDQKEIGPDEMLVPCTHFFRDIVNTFGIPFFVKVKNDEHFEAIKSRIQNRLDISDKEYEKYKFYFISQGRVNEVTPEYRIPLTDLKTAKDVWIGMEHMNKIAKQTRSNYMEKPIKIHN
ncbi:unnamed protein product [Gordionus sp. m RMFG-2023]|uniref:ubiquitin carboxyl-terminal hydrolase 7-like n=1 Tax=Gordionus sp. m RMFG-2023 TaxID=3053472 RepID=UPI0030E2E79D